jgi:hypothetical protein
MIEIPLEPQMRKLFEETEFFEGLRYPFNRQKQNEENIEDFLDGELYNNFADFFSDFGNISVSWNTDGIPIFKSSKFSVWPILIKFNSLPPTLREKYVLMIGLWFGDGKPWMNLFLKILADQMNQFYQEGFVVVTPFCLFKHRCYG